MLSLNERFIVNAEGHPVEVVLPIESYRQLLAWLAQAGPGVPGDEPLAEWRKGFRDALARAGYSSREQIVELMRDIKREAAKERLRRP
jgi:hypothetical protein